jgi:Mg2+/Co2+ transporter CorC
VELKNGEKKLFLQGLFRSVIRKSPETAEDLLQFMVSAETDLIEQLRRPTEQEMTAQIRHSVMPLFASVITE